MRARGALILGAAVIVGTAVGFTASAYTDTTSSFPTSYSAASSYCETPGTQTLTADSDTYTDENSPGTNFGADKTLSVQSRKSRNQRAFVRFSLPSLGHCAVTSATLKLNASSASSRRTIEVYRAYTSWSETGLTWTGQPGLAGAPSTASSATGWVSWSVTTLTQALYSSGNFGFEVKDDTEDANGSGQTQTYWSRTGSSPPELVITLG